MSNFKFLNINTGKTDLEISSPLNTSSTNLTDIQSPFTSLASITPNSFINSSLSNTPYSFEPTSTSTSRASSVVPNKLGLSVSVEEDDIPSPISSNTSQGWFEQGSSSDALFEQGPGKLCFVKKDEETFIKNRDNFNRKIGSIREKCKPPPSKYIVYNAQNSIIYNNQNPNILTKESKLMRETHNFLKYIPPNTKIDCTIANKLIEKSLNEADINEYYSHTLGSLYPEHFMLIQHLNTCKYEPDEDYSVFFKMENIQGVNFNKFFLEEKNQEIVDDILFKLILQITYVLIHSNMLGLYHNDIKLNNIMIYKTDRPEITYTQIKGIQLQIFDPNYFFKLIDYSDVVIINEQNPNKINLFDIIQFIFSIQDIAYKYTKSRELIRVIKLYLGGRNFFGEEEYNQVQVKELKIGENRLETKEEFRVFSSEEIMLHSVKVGNENIIGLFAEIKSVFSRENINIEIVQSAGTKYKVKYLQLKKLIK